MKYYIIKMCHYLDRDKEYLESFKTKKEMKQYIRLHYSRRLLSMHLITEEVLYKRKDIKHV